MNFSEMLRDYEKRIDQINAERQIEGLPFLPALGVRVLGQMSLWLDARASSSLHLVRTNDLDALLEGDWLCKLEFKRILEIHGLVYDELSSEIWIPPGSTFRLFYESHHIKCEYLDPLSTLLSKALKAPDKNSTLIREALQIYGPELEMLLRNHGFSW